MAELKMDQATVDFLVQKVKKENLGKIKVKKGDLEIVVEGKKPVAAAVLSNELPNEPALAAQASEPQTEQGNVVRSPIIGTFYAAPAPDKPAFVQVGQTVKEGDVLFIIESMKLMNEIKSEFSGVVQEIRACDGDSVEYNQPIMIIQ